jgi:hypothetical protein
MTTLNVQVLVKNQPAASVYLDAGFRPYELVLGKSFDRALSLA